MKKTIAETLAFFEVNTERDPERTITTLKESAPPILTESVHKAHGDRMPDDWIWNTYRRIVEAMSEYYGYDSTKESENILEDYRAEIVDGLVDVYTHDLTGWLHEHNSNVGYLTEAIEQGIDGADGYKLLARAQYIAIDEIYGEVVRYLEHRAKFSAELAATLSNKKNRTQ